MGDSAAVTGMRIRRRRQQLRMTQAELARRVGVNVSSVISWEKGEHFPRRHFAVIEELLGVNLTDSEGVVPYADPDELVIWRLAQFTDEEKRMLIAALRQERTRLPSRVKDPV